MNNTFDRRQSGCSACSRCSRVSERVASTVAQGRCKTESVVAKSENVGCGFDTGSISTWRPSGDLGFYHW